MFFKVGQIAKRIDMTVRALHHYDEIGLLSPSHHSDSGYRLYTQDDLLQLQKIKSLQQLGFSLEEIKQLLSSSTMPLSEVLNKHIQKLTLEANQQQLLVDRLQLLANNLTRQEQPSIELILDTLKGTIMFEKYYTPEQLNKLAEGRKQLGEKAMLDAQNEWQTIFAEFKKLQQAGESPSCPAAQVLAKRSNALIEAFTGGDPDIRQSLQTMYETEGGDKILSQGGMDMDKSLFDYYLKAMECVKKA